MVYLSICSHTNYVYLIFVSCYNTCTYATYPEHMVYEEVATSNAPVQQNMDSLDASNLAEQIQDRFTPEQASEL